MSNQTTDTRALWSTAFQDTLPDSSFAYIEPGGHKDAEGKTVPRTKRHLVYKDAAGKPDAAHVRNALARLSQTEIPETAKASALKKLEAAAKALGIEVADDDAAQGRAVEEASVTRDRAASAADITRVTLPSAVRVVDEARREIEVCATSEAVDSYGTIFDYAASKDAFQRWVGNLREMHAPKAVGRRIELRFDDSERKVYVRGRVSKGAPDTWEKVLDGTLQGASIGASNVTWERRMINGRPTDVATKYDLVELSLVDNPSNPDSLGITVMRASGAVDEAVFDELETPDTATNAAAMNAEAGEEAAAPEAGNAGNATDVADVAAAAAAESAPAAVTPAVTSEESDAPAAGASPVTGIPALDGEQHQTVSAGASVPIPDVPNAAAEAEPVPDPRFVGLDPNSEAGKRLYAQRRKEEEAAEVRRAGEAAVAAIGPRPRHEDPTHYYARVAQARGQAELTVQQAQLQRRRAEVAAAAVERAAATVAAAAAAAEAQPAQQAATPPVAGMPGAPETPSATRAEVGIAAREGAPDAYSQVQAATQNAPLTMARGAHTHSHAHMGYSSHQHAHEHTHLDGTTHSHPHRHEHTHHDLHDGAGANMSHDHEHTHLHDHTHTYRQGEPTDTRIAQAEALERAKGAALQTSQQVSQQTATATVRASAPSSSFGSGKGAGASKPASGSQLRPGKQQATSPVMSVQPQNVGHLDLVNTEDAEATGFGVPPVAEGMPTPGADSNEDELRTNPGDFHEGGHPADPGFTEGTYDADGDHDADEDEPRNDGPYDLDGDHDDGDADEDEPREPETGTPAASDPTSSSGGGEAASRPLPAAAKGRAPQDTSSTPNAGIPGGHRAAADAEHARAGRRLSAESMQQVHALRDGQLNHLAATCTLCGCPTCTGVLTVLNGGAFDEDGDHESGADNTPLISGEDVATFGQQRVLLAAVQRTQRQQAAQLAAQFTHLLGEVQRAYEAQITALQSTLQSAFEGRLADLELTIQDAQRSMSAQVAHVTAQHASQNGVSTADTSRDQMPELVRLMESAIAPVTTHLSEISQRMERVASDAEGLKAAVARIEQQPVTSDGPMAHLADLEHLAPLAGGAGGVVQRMAAGQTFGGRFGGAGNGAGGTGSTGGTGAQLSIQQRIDALTAVAQGIADPGMQTSIAGMILRLQQTQPSQ